RLEGLVLQPTEGNIQPTLVTGRAPSGPDEIFLGTRTARQLHRGVGDTVVAYITAVEPNPQRLRISGTGVLAPTSDQASLGEGAQLQFAAELHLAPPGVTPPPTGTAFVRFR